MLAEVLSAPAKPLEVPCPRCGAYMGQERIFCFRCGHRLIPLTPYDLAPEDFMYPPDRDGLEALRQFRVLTPIVKNFIIKDYVDELSSRLSREGLKIEFSSDLGAMIMECGVILGLKLLPEAYVIRDGRIGAFTFGLDDSQFLVLTSGLLRCLGEDEIRAVVAHELGHIKCEHVIYHTLAELLVRGMEFSSSFLETGLEMLSPIFRLILLSWYRESEVSADRASLLVVGDLNIMRSVFKKITLSHFIDERNMSTSSEPLSTHPTFANRMKLLENFYQSPEYERAKRKIAARLMLRKILVPRCRFCGSVKRLTDLFCPACGRSLI